MISGLPIDPINKNNERSSDTDQYNFDGIDDVIVDSLLIDNESISLATNNSSYLLSSNVCQMIDNKAPTLPPMLPIDPTPNPTDIWSILDIDETDKVRRYIQNQCFEGCQWSHPLMFKGSLDGQTYCFE